MQHKGITLDPFQEEAVRAIDAEESLLVAAPTGAGKTLVAEYAIERCLERGVRAVYTAPIKALSNQKFRDFTALYGDRIGIKTGDVTLNPDAQVVLMTTEIFRNTVFESPESLHDVRYAVFDEIHYLDDIERGTVWEESLIFAPPHLRILCLSATVPNLDQIARWIRAIRPEVPLRVIQEARRPVPLEYDLFVPGIGTKRLEDLKRLEKGDLRSVFAKLDPDLSPHRWRRALLDRLCGADRLPILWFAFNRRDCERFASHLHRPLLSAEERARMISLYDDLLRRSDIPPDPTTNHLRTLLEKGAAYHHAGLLPTLKEIVERLFTTGLLKLLFATETFAVGINMPARSVVFDSIFKWDGKRLGPIKTREHHQMAGRAGRRGIDPVGYVTSVVEWPDTRARVIERVLHGPIEPIRSQFNLSYATLLTLWDHLGDRIYTAAEKSFANFSGDRGSDQLVKNKVTQIRRRLEALNGLGYLREGKLTDKGRFARQIQGYELQVTELLFGGLPDRLSEEELCILFHGIVYEAKKSDWARRSSHGRFKWLSKEASRMVNAILRVEERVELEERTKTPDFKLASAVRAWAGGCAWGDLEAVTGASDGDLVRGFRLAVQLMRNTLHALPRGEPLRDKLRASVHRLNRDVVDAERQLRLATQDAGPEPPEPERSEPQL